MFVRQWEKEFTALNPNPEENSDFDSDNEINPIDTIENGVYKSSKIGVTNKMNKKPIQFSIIGKPNAGKSTLVNGLLKEYRVVASDIPGTTRDAVHCQWSYQGRRIILVDTAGIKPGTGVPKDKIEMIVNEMVDETVAYSHVVGVMIDCMHAFTSTDMQIIKRVLDEGRALVIVGNKWDLIEDRYKKKAVQWMNKQLEKGLGQAKAIPMTFVSAKTGLRVDMVMNEVLRVYEKWNTRISTGLLNKWLLQFNKVQKMPHENGKQLKIKYIMQIKCRPPTFFVFCNRKRICD